MWHSGLVILAAVILGVFPNVAASKPTENPKVFAT